MGGMKMVNNLYKSKVTDLIKKAKKKGLVKTYSQFCQTEEGKETSLSKDEIIYYTSINEGDAK